MGLDMNLYAKRFVSGFDGKETVEGIAKLLGSGNEILHDHSHAIVSIDVGYWRKANAIHNWFVKNVQDGEDDCGEYDVTTEQLEELRDLCKEVLANRDKAYEVLPPIGGFFFGSTDVDEWYFRDLEDTVKICEKCIALGDDWDFSYQASW